ncbi:MAG: glycosyltransferase family 4 protein, partial [Chthoniobacterales bacterium]
PDFLRLYQAAYVGLQLRGTGVERLHAHFAGMAARTAFWVREFFGIPFSFTAHANDVFAPREFAIGLPKLMEGAAAIVTVSDFSANDLRARFPNAADKVHRVYNGIALDRFRTAEFADETPLILSVGRLIEKKGFADLIGACVLLRDAGVEFRCEIIGEGPLEAVLAAQIAEAQVGARVRLVGPRSQSALAERLTAAHLFVLPCIKDKDGGMDNLPTVIMEAMASGLPVISTALAGVPEMVDPGRTGELVPERNPVALAGAMGDLLRDQEKARRLGRRGREVTAEKFAIERNVRALTRILQGMD